VPTEESPRTQKEKVGMTVCVFAHPTNSARSALRRAHLGEETIDGIAQRAGLVAGLGGTCRPDGGVEREQVGFAPRSGESRKSGKIPRSRQPGIVRTGPDFA
jgi:hypothetical protein